MLELPLIDDALTLSGLSRLSERKRDRKASRGIVGSMLARPGLRRVRAKAAVVHDAVSVYWTSPLQRTFARLLERYQAGLVVGDADRAGYNLRNRCHLLWHAGLPLGGLQRELQTGVSVLAQMDQTRQRNLVLPVMVAVKKLRSAECHDAEVDLEAISNYARGYGHDSLHAIAVIARLELQIIFQDWEAAAELLKGAGNLTPALAGTFNLVRLTFLEGLVCLKTAQASSSWAEKRRWKRRGRKSMKKLIKWVKKGNVNVLQTMHLLTAELAALEGNKKKAESNFASAIAAATRGGFLQDKALAHELAGAYRESIGDEYWACHHAKCARKAYSEWGALSKVNELKSREMFI